MLDAILSPEWEYRDYSFDSRWSEGELMASMRNGQGDHWFALFTFRGVVLHGLAHEAAMYRPDDPWPGIFDQVPSEFAAFLSEPAFEARHSTFCIWRRVQDAQWQGGTIAYSPGKDPDGRRTCSDCSMARPESYRTFAEDYHEVKVPLVAVEAIYRHEPLGEQLLAQLNPARDLGGLSEDMQERSDTRSCRDPYERSREPSPVHYANPRPTRSRSQVPRAIARPARSSAAASPPKIGRACNSVQGATATPAFTAVLAM